ncbi:MAG TPA: hypothetical protein VEW03_14925 [Longimicrobiaceae bacterium]|nr:hypothetical protein [Longimicrobiaceae bacterium]
MAIRLLPKRLIGQTIRSIRARLEQTPEEFARALGVPGGAAAVSAWEGGEDQPDYSTLAKIATMGVADVLIFHDPGHAAETPQLTPGEAAELQGILGRMEGLLGEARRIVARATDRTAVEMLEAATSRRAVGRGAARPAGRKAGSAAAKGKKTAPATSAPKRGRGAPPAPPRPRKRPAAAGTKKPPTNG